MAISVNGFQLHYDDRGGGDPLPLLHGDRDPLYPVELALEMYRAIPSSALWVVPNGGHGPIFGAMAGPFVETALAYLTHRA